MNKNTDAPEYENVCAPETVDWPGILLSKKYTEYLFVAVFEGGRSRYVSLKNLNKKILAYK